MEKPEKTIVVENLNDVPFTGLRKLIATKLLRYQGFYTLKLDGVKTLITLSPELKSKYSVK